MRVHATAHVTRWNYNVPESGDRGWIPECPTSLLHHLSGSRGLLHPCSASVDVELLFAYGRSARDLPAAAVSSRDVPVWLSDIF